MDTSDSEHFESADEDFHSDNDNEKQIKKKAVSEKKILQTSKLEDHLDTLNFNENCNDIDSADTNTNISRTIPNVDSGIVCDSEANRKLEINKIDDIQESIEIGGKKHHSETVPDEKTTEYNTVKTITDFPDNMADWKVGGGELTLSDILVKGIETNIRSESKEVLVDSSDENMWDNDDWEPLIENEETKVTELNESSEPQVDEENMWENDNWETLEEEKEKHQLDTGENRNTENPSWGGWGNWGVSSILTTASQSVSTLTNQVSQGFSTVLETGMGIPDAEELARLHVGEKSMAQKLEPGTQEVVGQNFSGFGFGNLSNLVSGVSNLTKFVEHTGSKVITGGLDTLETIGKKTMEVLQEGDPGLKNKRAFLKLDKEKPVLSQVLREAKEKAEQENKVLQQKNVAKKLNYESLFDDYHGLVHLEALEMLSKQCDIKLQTLKDNCTGNELTEIQETLDQIKELCELADEDDEDQSSLAEIEERISIAVTEIGINISYDRLMTTWKETDSWLNNLKLSFCDETELHQQAIQSLAQLTAMAVEQFHKAGELLLIKEHRSTADEADSLVQITMASTSLIGIVAGKFSDKLNAKASEHENLEKINEFITNVFFEAANSISYIQDAFQLIVPVLQVGAV